MNTKTILIIIFLSLMSSSHPVASKVIPKYSDILWNRFTLLRGFARYNSSSQQLLILLVISCLISLFGVLTPDRISFIINNFINLHSTFPGHGRRDGKIGLLIWSFYLYSLNMLPRQEKNSIKIKNIKLSWQCYYLVVYFYTDVSVALTLSLD